MSVSIFSPPGPKVRTTQGPADHLQWGNLKGSSLALAIAQYSQLATGPLLIVTSDTPTALRLEQEIRGFLPNPDKLSLFPDWETLPYDSFSPHQDIISQRLETLYRLTQAEHGIFILPIMTLAMRLAPTEYLGQYLLMLHKGQRLDMDAFRNQLQRAGYHAVKQVMHHGEYALRGSLVDLFPMGLEQPLRLDMFDNEIESIRTFDPDTQRSGDTLERVRLLPAHEFPTDQTAIERFKHQYRREFERTGSKASVYHQVASGTLPGGIEYYLPLFFEQTNSLFDYLNPGTQLMLFGDLNSAAEHFWQDVLERYEQRRYNVERPLLAPERLFLRIEQLFGNLRQWPRVSVQHDALEDKQGRHNFATASITDIQVNPQLKRPLSPLKARLASWQDQGVAVVFAAESAGRKESLKELLGGEHISPASFDSLDAFIAANAPLGIIQSPAQHSFLLEQDGQQIAFITENELLGHKISQRRRREKQRATDENAIIKNLAELSVGQPVVHLDHGVGRYLGLQTLDAGGVTTEFLNIEYAKGAKLYVPVANLNLISRYSGGEADKAPLNALGSDQWNKARRKAAERARDVAAQLLDVYAKRAAKPGYAFTIDWPEYRSFADSFPFEETADQEQAINAVIQDMGSPTAMDRLVCGDVGFGKTEVAMRAAFLAANAGKQVAVLVPTTLLAQQHYENFKDRFANWPFTIQVMSRFVTGKNQKGIIDGITTGKVDIVVGTHKLLSEDIKFNDLGLVIIDEEHRFGVKQKDKFKAMRADVDILTLTATPIPRTLNMSLNGMRDLSIIATPPARRLSIKTFVQQRDKTVIREAIMREILRGGQVYFLHNEVETIERTAEELADIVPEARMAIGHGQMRERELEQVMSDFYHQRSNVLVCTTIIETGIDVPSANTIIMDRADHLGLAQLHQLRGRVGRSHHQAYAYLLTPHPRRMTKDAQKRLEAIASLEDLGAGFALATHDLEIRGAGELLGEEQSGQITSIGFSLYMDMLDKAVKTLKDGKEPSLEDVLAKQTEIELRIPSLLPESYIDDVNLRLSMYKKIASCSDKDELDQVQVELIDRFGLLPEPAKNLIAITGFKQRANALGINKIEANDKGGSVEFDQHTPVDPRFIIELIQTQSRIYKFDGAQKLKFTIPTDSAKARLALIDTMLSEFQQRLRAN